MVRRNRVTNGLVYLQVTRGERRPRLSISDCGHQAIAGGHIQAHRSGASPRRAEKGVGVVTVPENRWERVDIKSTGLLPNVLAKQKAREAGAFEAWFVDSDGNVKEGSSSNAWIVTKDGVLVTRPAESGILRGITRTTLLDVARKLGMKFEERGFTVEEAKQAREAFLTSATTVVMPIVASTVSPSPTDIPARVALSLRQAFFDIAEKIPA